MHVRASQPWSARGASLLDELTAVVVLSVGLLALAGLQGRIQNLALNSETRTAALALAESRLERLRGIANEPDEGAGYARIASSSETMTTVAGQHLDVPITLGIDAARFRLQDDASKPRYVAVEQAAAPSEAPEFKRVTITASWTDRYGTTNSVVLPGILSRGAF
jgi:Tfp pilus assembly protein PilV